MSLAPKADHSRKEPARFAGFTGAQLLALFLVFATVTWLWFYSPTIVRYVARENGVMLKDSEAKSDGEKLAEFGDQFAALNTLFAGFAFVGLIAALIFQRQDLVGQLESLRQQVNEFETQNTLTKQQMAFQEIQARVAALPSLEARWRAITVTNHLGTPVPSKEIHLINHGADIFNVQLMMEPVQFLLAKCQVLKTGQKIGCEFQAQMPMPETKFVVIYSTRYAEIVAVPFVLSEDRTETNVTLFFKDAGKIREDVLKRLGVSLD